jgi:sulfur carrier protein ThiS
VYAVPLVKPETVQEVDAVVQVNDPGDEVTVYPVIALPPLDPGALQLTTDEESAAVPETPVGAPGTVLGVTLADALEATEFPAAFVALTVNVYAVPLVKPETVQEVDAVVQVNDPGDEVTVYPVIALPPLDPGALQLTTDEESAAVPETPVGAPGTVLGVTLADALEATEFPAAFVALTVNVYAVPLVKPETVQEVDAVVQVNDPGDEVTVYPVIALPPLDPGALQLTTDEESAAVPETPVGAPGTVLGVTLADALEATEFPIAFVALTVNVYAVPLVKPETVQEVDAVVQVNDPGDEVTVYPVIALPPLDPGALQLTTDEESAAVPETPVGAPGTVGAATATLSVAIEGDESPLAFVATTTNL